MAHADIAGSPLRRNPVFEERASASRYPPGQGPGFTNYGQGFFCGTDGLPRLIAMAASAMPVISESRVCFSSTSAGTIGWAGRAY